MSLHMFLSDLLMNMAVITGSQPEYNSWRLAGCLEEMTIHSGVRHMKKAQTRDDTYGWESENQKRYTSEKKAQSTNVVKQIVSINLV